MRGIIGTPLGTIIIPCCFYVLTTCGRFSLTPHISLRKHIEWNRLKHVFLCCSTEAVHLFDPHFTKFDRTCESNFLSLMDPKNVKPTVDGKKAQRWCILFIFDRFTNHI